MQTSRALRELLARIDRRSYPTYKDTRGSWQFPGYVLSIDHVQGDPFAAPSQLSVHVDGGTAAFPPALYRLREVDREHGSLYYETLRVYLECERSLSETAKQLFIHRNTLLYRLDKLCEQTGLRLDDADQRLHLRISFRLMQKQEEEENHAAN